MIPCVILASTPKPNASPADVDKLKLDYFDFVKGTIRSKPMKIRLCDPDDQDGGNGTGLEPGGGDLLPEIGTLGKTFYDFTTHPSGDRDTKYPKLLRFELCLPFGDIGQALHYIQSEGPGQRLDKVFTYVQIVALSATAFTATPGKAQYL